MVTKGRLKMALAQEKGVDFKKLHQKKKAKEAEKKKQTQPGGAPEDEDNEDETPIDVTAMMDDSASSDSEVEMEAKIVRPPKSALKQTKAAAKPKKAAEKAEEEDDEEEEEDSEEEEDPEADDIAMSDLEDLEDEDRDDLVPHQRLTINNTVALEAALKRIALPTDKAAPFKTHLSVTGVEPTEGEIPDVMDDLQRELAFYGQALDAARQARARCRTEGVPFSRPNDYFAEMVKDDGHMEKVKERLVQEASAKKASAEARKLRDLKKFGKQVQVAKLQERQKAKKETLEKIQSLKRKRSENSGDLGTHEADLFDVGVEDELAGYDKKKRGAGGRAGGDRTPNPKRQKKDAKFGFGGKKRHAKSGDAISSGDMSGFSAKRMKEKPQGTKALPRKTARLGKSRRNAGKR